METVKIKVWVSIGLVRCKKERVLTFDREEWEEMTDEEREEVCREEMLDMVEWDYEEVKNK